MGASFKLDSLTPGMRLLLPIFYQGGQLLGAGSTVTDRHLRQLRSWNIESFEVNENVSSLAQVAVAESGEIEIFDIEAMGLAPKKRSNLPPGREIDGGATYMVDENILFTGEEIVLEQNLVVNGGVGPGVKMSGSGFIKIVGHVEAGATISAAKELTIQGTVKGMADKPVLLSGDAIVLAAAEWARINARVSVTAEALKLCETKAEERVDVHGEEKGVVGGRIDAGAFIHLQSCEGFEGKPAILCILHDRKKQLFATATALKKQLAEKRIEFSRLEKVIEVIRLLGDKVTSLPAEKKQELALQTKRYLELKNECAGVERSIALIEEEMETGKPALEMCPILIQNIKPSIEMSFGSNQLTLNARQTATGYYLKGNRVFAVAR